MLEQIRGVSVAKFKQVCSRIILVNSEDPVPHKELKRYAPYTNLQVGGYAEPTWYQVLRELQGQLDPYITGEVRHMTDDGEFLQDSSCEWAYIVNTNTKALEV